MELLNRIDAGIVSKKVKKTEVVNFAAIFRGCEEKIFFYAQILKNGEKFTATVPKGLKVAMGTRKTAKNGELVNIYSHSFRDIPKKYNIAVNFAVKQSELLPQFTAKFTVLHREVHRIATFVERILRDGQD